MVKTIIKTYDKTMIGDRLRKMEEKRLTAKGYMAVSEEDVNQFSGGRALLFGAIFLPLAFLGRKQKVKVTYELVEENPQI